MPGYAAIVLAGGAGRRLGGVDKANLAVGDQTLLARALTTLSTASPRIVVGPLGRQRVPADVIGVQEQPPGGGPVAAIDAGLAEVGADVVVVLACDMPLVTAGLVDQLVDTLTRTGTQADTDTTRCRPADGVLPRDDHGRRQPLAAAYRTTSLRRAVAELPKPGGAAMRELLRNLELVELPVSSASVLDCDTWESVATCRTELQRRGEVEQL